MNKLSQKTLDNIERTSKGKDRNGPALFSSGQHVVTSGVLDLADFNGDTLYYANAMTAFRRMIMLHTRGFWGDCDEHDEGVNDQAVAEGYRTMSVHYFNVSQPHKTLMSSMNGNDDGPYVKLWIITEWDRSVTTILLPSEY